MHKEQEREVCWGSMCITGSRSVLDQKIEVLGFYSEGEEEHFFIRDFLGGEGSEEGGYLVDVVEVEGNRLEAKEIDDDVPHTTAPHEVHLYLLTAHFFVIASTCLFHQRQVPQVHAAAAVRWD